MYLSRNPRVRFGGPSRYGLGGYDAYSQVWDWVSSKITSLIQNAKTGMLTTADEAAIYQQAAPGIIQAAPNNPALQQAALEQLRKDIHGAVATANQQAAEASVGTIFGIRVPTAAPGDIALPDYTWAWILGGAALVIVATR